MNRYPDWPSRLNAYLADVQKKIPEGELDYSKFHCLIYLADGIEVMTGVDLYAEHRGRYKTQTAAFRELKKAGGLKSAISSKLGDPKPAAMATHGDAVYWDNACGFCVGKHSLFLSDGGFSYVPTLKVECAFNV